MPAGTALLTYYFAMSLDGYIARANDTVDWQDPFIGDSNNPYDFGTFLKTVDAVVMGRKTCDFIKSRGAYPYPGKRGLVISRDRAFVSPYPELTVLNEGVERAIVELKRRHAQRVWLVGGGYVAAELMELELIDELIFTIVPMTLGHGKMWLPRHGGERRWKLADQYVSPKGLLQARYVRANNRILDPLVSSPGPLS
jgi:dihydrofolate reductase